MPVSFSGHNFLFPSNDSKDWSEERKTLILVLEFGESHLTSLSLNFKVCYIRKVLTKVFRERNSERRDRGKGRQLFIPTCSSGKNFIFHIMSNTKYILIRLTKYECGHKTNIIVGIHTANIFWVYILEITRLRNTQSLNYEVCHLNHFGAIYVIHMH
jgi:hypothetical protein